MKRFLILSFVLLLASCSSVHFDQSFPTDQKPLGKFNNELIGKYYYCDSSYKTINGDLFYNSKYYSIENFVKDSLKLLSAELVIQEKAAFYIIKKVEYYDTRKIDAARLYLNHKDAKEFTQNNYLGFKESFTDTVIAFNRGDELRQYDNKYYLNRLIEKGNWDICQLDLKNEFCYTNFTSDEDAEELSDKKSKSVFQIAHISNGRFLDFVKRGGFREHYKWQKLPK